VPRPVLGWARSTFSVKGDGNGLLQQRALVEVDDGMEDWLRACEAVLGAYRQAVFVPPDKLEAAFGYLSRNRRIYHNVRLANTRKIENGRVRAAAPDAVVSVLKTDDPLVRGFLDGQFGHTRRAGSAEEVRRLDNAITVLCEQSQGLGLRVHSGDQEPVLGRFAQVEALRKRQSALAQLDREIPDQIQLVNALTTGRDLLEQLAEIDMGRLETAWGEYEAWCGIIRDLKAERDTQSDPESLAYQKKAESFDRDVRTLEARVAEIDGQTGALQRQSGSLETRQQALEADLARYEDERSSRWVILSGPKPIAQTIHTFTRAPAMASRGYLYVSVLPVLMPLFRLLARASLHGHRLHEQPVYGLALREIKQHAYGQGPARRGRTPVNHAAGMRPTQPLFASGTSAAANLVSGCRQHP
jgi:hypothetical protein